MRGGNQNNDVRVGTLIDIFYLYLLSSNAQNVEHLGKLYNNENL